MRFSPLETSGPRTCRRHSIVEKFLRMDQRQILHFFPHDLYPFALGASGLTMGIDVCCVSRAVVAERFISPAFRFPPGTGIAHGMDLPSAVVIRSYCPLGGIKGRP